MTGSLFGREEGSMRKDMKSDGKRYALLAVLHRNVYRMSNGRQWSAKRRKILIEETFLRIVCRSREMVN